MSSSAAPSSSSASQQQLQACLPSNLRTIKGDLLTLQSDCILQQCNCISVRAKGLAEVIGKKFPYADLYRHRKASTSNRNVAQASDCSKPGTCVLAKSISGTGPIVGCLFGQYHYGKPGRYKLGDAPNTPDSAADREHYFWQALLHFHVQALKLSKPIKTLGFPYNIGCGLAGGHWQTYYNMIVKFATTFPQYQITIVRLDDAAAPATTSTYTRKPTSTAASSSSQPRAASAAAPSWKTDSTLIDDLNDDDLATLERIDSISAGKRTHADVGSNASSNAHSSSTGNTSPDLNPSKKPKV